MAEDNITNSLQAIKESINNLREISKVVQNSFNSEEFLTTELNKITPEGRKRLWEIYKGKDGAVTGIRAAVAELLIKGDVTSAEIKNIIDAAKIKDPNAYSRMYRNWYNILYVFVLLEYKGFVNQSVEVVNKSILSTLGSPPEISSVKFDFTGERETGSTRLWIAFFNKGHKKQDTAKQLFINIENGKVFYSFYDRPQGDHIDSEEVIDGQDFEPRRLVDLFKRHVGEVLGDTPLGDGIKTIQLKGKEKVYKISMGPDDIDNETYNFSLSQNLVMVHGNTKPLGQTYEPQGKMFTETIVKGDYFYLCRGNKMILVGQFDGTCEPASQSDWGNDGWFERGFVTIEPSIKEGKYEGDQKWWAPNFRSTCRPIPPHELEQANKDLFVPFFKAKFIPPLPIINDPKKILMDASLNTILYGPPGTGKTFSTITRAIEITNPNFRFPLTDSDADRELVKKEYRRLELEGKIAFITFHQSMSYEDFIEGIKPQLGTEKLTYMLVDGIFKSLCERARHISGNFTEVIDKLKALVSEEDGKVPTIIKSTTTTFDIIYRGGTVFYVHPHNSVKNDSWYPVNIENIRLAFEADSLQGVYNSTYVREIIAYLKQNFGLVRGNKKETEVKENYVMIIDEINRGNISQIFGELITLLEADKREGRPEALSAKLPYSKLDFSVPDNVYIIGTMNTADRSVEALDSALRRRFSFEHMPPNPEMIPAPTADIEIDLKKTFEVINQRVAYLLDSDHQIGHSYFMKMKDERSTVTVFKNEIIPLLKEYFYNDFGKLRMVLGDGLIKIDNEIKPNTLFAVADEGYITEKTSYKFVPDEELFDGIKLIIKNASQK